MSIENKPEVVKTEAPKVETPKQLISGGDIKAFFSKPPPKTVKIEHDGKEFQFLVQSLDNSTYVKIGKEVGMMTAISEDNPLTELKIFAEVYYPACKVAFPICCVNPKVVDGTSTDPAVLELDNIPIPVCVLLLIEIMGASGLTEKEQDIRKK